MNNTRRTALVTGASSGIGLEIARVLAETGHDLVVVARSERALSDLGQALRSEYGASVHSYPTDLTEPNATSALWKTLVNDGVCIDILVNNAGSALYGQLAGQDLTALLGMIELNVVALTTLTRLALPAMLGQRWGRVLNVASLTAYQPGGPRMAAYYGTKSYVLSFSKGLARELHGTGVSVTALCPGPSDTPFDRKSGAGRTILYRYVPKMSPAAIARSAYRGLTRQSTVEIPGLVTKALAFAGELPPRGIALAVNRLLLTEV
jgi:hypothetical protein